MGSKLKDIMSQEMDRREFLVRVGLLLLALIGLNAIIRAFTETGPSTNAGYGAGVYGSNRVSNKIRLN